MLLGIFVFKDALLSIARLPTSPLFALPHSSPPQKLVPLSFNSDHLTVMGIIANSSSQFFFYMALGIYKYSSNIYWTKHLI